MSTVQEIEKAIEQLPWPQRLQIYRDLPDPHRSTSEDLDWQRARLEKFFEDDSPDDKVYDLLETGDVVAVDFPYSDLQGRKRRPGLVFSIDESDILLARITTRPPREPEDVLPENWSAAALPKPSTVRPKQTCHGGQND